MSMAASAPEQLAAAVRNACIQAALDGYERAQIAGLCHEGAWECAVDAIRMVDLGTILQDPAAALQQARDRDSAAT
ncbi:MAG: hypothetical protein U1A72_19750 [Sulfuritalea sp.]|nr:hypothetical protein [Sulfuritalea sp.]